MQSYPPQRASASGGIPNQPHHLLWRETLVHFSLQQWQVVRLFRSFTVVGDTWYVY
jgi:hypothetical protein